MRANVREAIKMCIFQRFSVRRSTWYDISILKTCKEPSLHRTKRDETEYICYIATYTYIYVAGIQVTSEGLSVTDNAIRRTWNANVSFRIHIHDLKIFILYIDDVMLSGTNLHSLWVILRYWWMDNIIFFFALFLMTFVFNLL